MEQNVICGADDNQGCIALAQHSFHCAICQHGPSKMVCAECFSLDVTVELTSAGRAGWVGGWADSIDTRICECDNSRTR